MGPRVRASGGLGVAFKFSLKPGTAETGTGQRAIRHLPEVWKRPRDLGWLEHVANAGTCIIN